MTDTRVTDGINVHDPNRERMAEAQISEHEGRSAESRARALEYEARAETCRVEAETEQVRTETERARADSYRVDMIKARAEAIAKLIIVTEVEGYSRHVYDPQSVAEAVTSGDFSLLKVT